MLAFDRRPAESCSRASDPVFTRTGKTTLTATLPPPRSDLPQGVPASGEIRCAGAGRVSIFDPEIAWSTGLERPATEIPFREEMEASFGESFAGVRAHLGAGEAMGALGARAAARGEDVVFAGGAPDRELVAHELTHVVQGRRGDGGQAGVSSPGDRSEREADGVAARAAAGERVEVATGGGRGIFRKPLGSAELEDEIDFARQTLGDVFDAQTAGVHVFAEGTREPPPPKNPDLVGKIVDWAIGAALDAAGAGLLKLAVAAANGSLDDPSPKANAKSSGLVEKVVKAGVQLALARTRASHAVNKRQPLDSFVDGQHGTILLARDATRRDLQAKLAAFRAVEEEHPGEGLAAVRAVVDELLAMKAGAPATQRDASARAWCAALARFDLGEMDTALENPGTDLSKMADLRRYNPCEPGGPGTTWNGWRGQGLIDLRGAIVAPDAPVTVYEARVRGLNPALFDAIENAPLRSLGVPFVLQAEVAVAPAFNGGPISGALAVGINESGAVFCDADEEAREFLVARYGGAPGRLPILPGSGENLPAMGRLLVERDLGGKSLADLGVTLKEG